MKIDGAAGVLIHAGMYKYVRPLEMTNKRGLVAARKQKPWKVAALSSKSFTNPWLSCYKYSDDTNTRTSKILPILEEISKRASLCC